MMVMHQVLVMQIDLGFYLVMQGNRNESF